jgi:hypothetical protein
MEFKPTLSDWSAVSRPIAPGRATRPQFSRFRLVSRARSPISSGRPVRGVGREVERLEGREPGDRGGDLGDLIRREVEGA